SVLGRRPRRSRHRAGLRAVVLRRLRRGVRPRNRCDGTATQHGIALGAGARGRARADAGARDRRAGLGVPGPVPAPVRPLRHAPGREDVPERLNWAILAASAVATAGCLWIVSHAPMWAALAAAAAFAFLNNTPFSIMHEAVHGVGAATPSRNYALGV